MTADGPALYRDLADWWPLLSPPEDHAEEAAYYERTLVSACARSPRTMLEPGSGGGNNASYLKRRFRMTLVDLSPGMLAVSRSLNPECEHLEGDMRTVRLGRQFDCVFVHDAVSYMATEADLRQVVKTARAHCAPGGAVLLAPDYVRETFRPSTTHGGIIGAGRPRRAGFGRGR
jgi:trans-aconitate methyltransferase